MKKRNPDNSNNGSQGGFGNQNGGSGGQGGFGGGRDTTTNNNQGFLYSKLWYNIKNHIKNISKCRNIYIFQLAFLLSVFKLIYFAVRVKSNFST